MYLIRMTTAKLHIKHTFFACERWKRTQISRTITPNILAFIARCYTDTLADVAMSISSSRRTDFRSVLPLYPSKLMVNNGSRHSALQNRLKQIANTMIYRLMYFHIFTTRAAVLLKTLESLHTYSVFNQTIKDTLSCLE